MLFRSSQTTRAGTAEIRDYYVYFLQREPRVSVETRTIRLSCGLASDAGIYVLYAKTRAGRDETFRVRYSFIYEERNGQWLIVHEHASLGPDLGSPDRVVLAPADPFASQGERPKAVAGFVRRTTMKRRPATGASDGGLFFGFAPSGRPHVPGEADLR